MSDEPNKSNAQGLTDTAAVSGAVTLCETMGLRRLAVSLRRILWRVEHAEVFLSAFKVDNRPPAFPLLVDAGEPGCIGAEPAQVSLVSTAGHIAQVLNAIIQCVAVDVVNDPRRPLTMYQRPREPVPSNTVPEQTDTVVANASENVYPACLIPSLHLVLARWGFDPEKVPGARFIAQVFAPFIYRYSHIVRVT